MKVAIIYNKDFEGVLNRFGMQNKETYSPLTVKKVTDALESGGHNVTVIDGNMHVIERLQNFMPKVIDGEQMGMVFNMAYGIQGESRYTHIPSMLEMLGIPYVGSSPAGHALALDKVITKIIMQKHGIATPDFWVFSDPMDDMDSVKYPVIVKPKMESVSFGLKIVYNVDDLREAVNFIVTEFQQQALVEQFIRGREFCVGLLGNNPVEAFPVLEVDLEGNPDGIQTVDDKRTTPRGKICPAEISEEIKEKMISQSISAFKALQLRDFSRVDIRMDNDNNIYLLEINSMASLGETGSYPSAAKVAGYNFKTLVNKILDIATVRYFANTRLMTQLPDENGKLPLHVKMRGFLRSRQDAHTKLLKKMVNSNSYVRNVEGVNELGNIIKKELAFLGFAQEVIPQMEVGNQLFFSNSFDNEYDILIVGNMDNNTKIAKHEMFHEEELKLLGTGIWEHKGGLAIMIAALQGMKFSRWLSKLKIGILLTSDDSLQGKFAKSIIVEKSSKASLILGLHGGDLNGSIVTSRSGSAVYRFSQKLISDKQTDHVPIASSIFTKLIHSWCEMSVNDNKLVISPSNTFFKSNIMQPYAFGETTLSVRFNQIEDFKTVDSKIKKLIPKKKYKDFLNFQIEGGLRRPPMLESDMINRLWRFVKKIAVTLDTSLSKEHRWSSSDLCFLDSDKNIIDGLGPIGVKPQDSSEYILRHSFIDRALLLGMIMYEAHKINYNFKSSKKEVKDVADN